FSTQSGSKSVSPPPGKTQRTIGRPKRLRNCKPRPMRLRPIRSLPKKPGGPRRSAIAKALTSVRLKMPFWLMRWQRSKVSKKKPTPRAVAEPVPSGLMRSWPTCRSLKTRVLSPSSPPRSKKMAKVTIGKKACAVNPLKMSQPIGGALAFMGLRGAMPLLHGSQGCTSFGLVLFVRHFKEAIPLQTTAMSEVATVLGGYENVEQAILNIYNRTKPEIIGICSTGVTETKGDD